MVAFLPFFDASVLSPRIPLGHPLSLSRNLFQSVSQIFPFSGLDSISLVLAIIDANYA